MNGTTPVSQPSQHLQPNLPERSELLAEVSAFLVRLEEIEIARRNGTLSDFELPLRRLQQDLLGRSEFASWCTSQRLAHAYSLAVQEAAAVVGDLRLERDERAWPGHVDRARKALQKAATRVRRIDG